MTGVTYRKGFTKLYLITAETQPIGKEGCELFVSRDAINPSLGATLTSSRLQRPEKRTAHTQD